MVMGDVDPDQDAGAPHLVAVAGGELDHQPSLPPRLEHVQLYHCTQITLLWGEHH